jgi:integrase
MSLPKWIQQRLDTNIIPKLNKLNEKDLLKGVKEIVYYGQSQPKDRTITWRYSMVKKYLREHIKDKDVLKKIKPPTELTEKVIKSNIEIRDSEKRLLIDEDLINKILSFENSKNCYEMYIYLLFISGRRLREITDAKFINIKSNNSIKIDGIKKQKEDQIHTFKPLVSKTKFFRVYRKFNRICKNSIIKNMSGNLQRIIKKKLGTNMKAHDLRKIYAVYSYKFRNDENLKINPFIKKLLNHTSTDASMSYTGIHINFDNDIVKKSKKIK